MYIVNNKSVLLNFIFNSALVDDIWCLVTKERKEEKKQDETHEIISKKIQ